LARLTGVFSGGDGRALRAMTRLVILRAVAGSTPANDVAAGVDSATARGMTWLDGRLRDDAVASPQIGEEPFSRACRPGPRRHAEWLLRGFAAGKGWARTLESLVARAPAGLGVTDPVAADLYKLLIYDQGSHFVSHRDTEKAPGRFATLIITLPSVHAGGELVVRHKGREVRLDMRCDDGLIGRWVASGDDRESLLSRDAHQLADDTAAHLAHRLPFARAAGWRSGCRRTERFHRIGSDHPSRRIVARTREHGAKPAREALTWSAGRQ
jgi:hypothetical protein